MQQPFCLMDGSVCSCYMHYTGFPSALHSPCLPTFSHLHLGLATLGTYISHFLHALKTENLLKKIAEHHFNPFRVEKRAFTLGKTMGFPACTDQSKAYLFSKPCCGMHNTTWNSQRGIWHSGIWILLNTSSCEGKWPRAAPAITMRLRVVGKGNMEISALNFSSSILFLGWWL